MKHIFTKELLVCGLFICTLFFYACNSPTQKAEDTQEKVDAFIAAKEKIGQHVDKVIHDLPAPGEVSMSIKKKGIPFSKTLVNPLHHIEEYLISNSKAALNLGVYASDIGYLVSYNQPNEAQAYLNSCQKIAERLGISTALGTELYNRFQANKNNNDSLIAIINEAMRNVEVRLEDLDELRIASLALSGMFIEGLYITVNIMEQVHANSLQESDKENNIRFLVDLIQKQEVFLLDLKSILKETERDANIIQLIDGVELITFRFDDLDSYVEAQKENDRSIKITDVAISELIAEIKKIRAHIIST